ncbi:S8 family serine peptidase [Streptomyces sp. CBG31]|uniref:S8 family serine peptidase n=1 Tax=Streptomyces sp. CBG31 TaxID=2762623 RepID=UPI001EFDB01E|nr:S8 family serine peptidase [Streptomyces sp. CBG31]
MPFLRPTVAAIATAALAAGTLSVSALPAAAAPAPQPVAAADKLGAHDRALIKQYQQQSRARSAQPDALRATPDFVTLIVAVQEGRTAAVAEEIAALGAEVTRTDAEVGYVKVNAPFATVDALLALDGVVAVDADELLQLEDVRPDGELTGKGHGGKGGSGARKLPAGPSAKTPDANPYMPTGETGSADFKKRHKTYDGRGVTIGIMDSGVDPTHPALAKTTTGERKLVDTVTGTDPNNFIDMLFDNTWQLVSRQVSGPKYTDPDTGNVWTLPEEEGLRFSAKTNTLPNGFTGKIGVLHRDGDDAVRVDTDGDLDFTDEELMRPYAEKHQVGFLGKDDPATGINESVPFTVQVKRDMLSSSVIGVALNYIDVAHGTHVAGITAAHGMFGGKMDGQAPGAKLVSMRACHSLGCSSAALTDGMIDLAHDHGVDVINMSIGSSPEFNDGQSARALVYNRLVEESGVQLFISGGNSGAGANTIGDPTAADQVVSVGASVSADTYWANYGSEVKAKRDIFPFSSRGPREDGGFKPDITAPGSAVAPTPSWIAPTSVAETGYTLPAGYSMMNGTSMASPQATGAAALLLSAAGQKRLAPSPAELRAAIYSSAAPIRGVTAIAQGRGQFDVAGAWKHLEKRNGTGDAVTVSAPVCTPLSGQLVTPHTGSGVFNSCAPTTGGQKPGESRTYEVTLTRTSGKAGSAPYKLDLTGDTGSFSVPRTVKLAKGVPTTVKVTAKPRAAGVHSAVLTIDNPATKAVDQHAMLAVEAGADLTDGWKVTGVSERNGTTHYTVVVPEGTKSLDVKLSGAPEGSQIRWWAFGPTGMSAEKVAAGTLSCYSSYYDGYGCAPEGRSYADPKPGVWELVVESRRTTPVFSAPFTLEGSVTR